MNVTGVDRRRFARANHVLVPSTHEERDRYRRTRIGRALSVVARVFRRFSVEAQPFLVLVMISGALAFDVRRTQLYVAWGALAGLLGASFVCSFFYGLPGVRVRVDVARRVARGVPVRLTVALTNETDRAFMSLRTRGPFLPWDGEWVERGAALAVLEPRARAHLTLEAKFHERGEHHLDPIRVQALVPLGLAMGAPLATEAPRFVVVPRLANVVGLELPRTRKHHPGGVPRAVHTADSRELAGVRPYRPGDAVRDLHVRTWARTGVPHVREYQEEYFSHVAVLVDAGPKPRGRREWTDEPLEAALSVAAGVTAKLLGGEALVDLAVLGDRSEEDEGLALGRGRGTLEAALDRLATVERAAGLDVEREVARFVGIRERLSGMVVVCSHWDAARVALVERLEAEGLAPLVVVCASSTPAAPITPGARMRVVSTAAVIAGEALSL